MSTSDSLRNNSAPSSRVFREENPRPTSNLGEVRYHAPRKPLFPPWLLPWLPAIVWSVLIFFASTDTFSASHTRMVIEPVLRWFLPYLSDDQLDHIHFLIRKCAHFSEYFVFYLLLYRGIRAGRKGWHWSWAFAAWFIAAAYSALDEIHQSFVASRTASAWDSLLDSTGALVALFVLFFFYRLFRRAASV
jgi:VanZ family protein